MRAEVHTWLGYILIAIGLSFMAAMINSGGRFIDVGYETYITQSKVKGLEAQLEALDNQTRVNRKVLDSNHELMEKAIKVLESREALVIPKKKK